MKSRYSIASLGDKYKEVSVSGRGGGKHTFFAVNAEFMFNLNMPCLQHPMVSASAGYN